MKSNNQIDHKEKQYQDEKEFNKVVEESIDQEGDHSLQLKYEIFDKNQMYFRSPYKNFYLKEFAKNTPFPTLEMIKLKLVNIDGTYINEFQTSQQFEINKIYESRNKKIMKFEVVFSYFVTWIKILNLTPKDNLNLTLKNWINEGGYGTIYKVNIDGKKYAVKKINISNYDFRNHVKEAIKEYCFMKLCGIFQIGPAPASIFGFDLITTENGIYFSSQLGIPIYDHIRSQTNSIQDIEKQFDNLKQSLMLLHFFKINHNDIKNNNIVYSPTFKKLVFIDFGLSDVNPLGFGFMKKEKAKGSIEYCCDDMKKLFFNNRPEGLVDLYFNDAVGLIKTRQSIRKIFIDQISSKIMRNASQCISLSKYLEEEFLSQYNQIFQEKFVEKNQNNINSSCSSYLEIEKIFALNILYHIEEKNVFELEKLIERIPSLVEVLNKYLSVIAFVFFQGGKNTSLQLIYKKIKKYLQNTEILPQTRQCFQIFLEPYFAPSFLPNNYESFNIEKYVVEAKFIRQLIALRYHENFDENQSSNKFCRIENQFTDVTIRSMQDTEKVTKLLLQNFDKYGYELVSQVIKFQVGRTDSFLCWYQITQSQIKYLEESLQKLQIRINFQFFSQTGHD